MIFDTLRHARKITLATAFAVAAAGTIPPESPQQAQERIARAELQLLAGRMRSEGPLMPAQSIERFKELVGRVDATTAQNAMATAGMCGHASGGGSGGGGSGGTGPAAGCPHRRRKGDLSHLLAIDSLF